MFGDVEDEEGRDAFVFGDVSDGGVVTMFVGVVAKFLAVTEAGLGELVDAAACFSGFNNGRDIKGITVHWHAGFDDIEREALGFEVTVVDGDERGELRAGGVAHDEQAFGIAAVLGNMVVDPADGFGDVAKDGDHFNVWQKAITGGNEDEIFCREGPRFDLDGGPMADLPAAAVNPEDNGKITRAGRSVDIELVALVPGIGIWNVAMDSDLRRGGSGLFAGEIGEAGLQLIARGGAAIENEAMAEEAFATGGKGPVGESRDVGIDEALFIGAPAGRMVRVGGMIENGDAKGFSAERAFDITPGGALLFACAVAEAIRVEMGLARIVLVPRHANGEAADKEFPEVHVAVFGAEKKIEIDEASIGGFRSVDGDGVFLLENDGAAGCDKFD